MSICLRKGLNFDENVLRAVGVNTQRHYTVIEVLTTILPALDEADPQP